MKKNFTVSGLFMAMLFVMICSFGSCAQDCSSSVDKISDAYLQIAKEVKGITAIDQLDKIDFNGAIDKAGVNEIAESCNEYQLTSADKDKLKKSFKTFYDSMVDKIVELAGGFIGRDDIDAQMSGLLNAYNNITDKSKTLGDYIEGLQTLGM